MEAVESLLIIKHSPFPAPRRPRASRGSPRYGVPVGQGARRRAHGGRHAFRPASIVNVSGMSYGSLSPVARRGPQPRCADRGLPAEHRGGRHRGRALPRRRAGLPDRHRLLRLSRRARPLQPRSGCASAWQQAPVRAIEIKLSQGAKPGLGGLLPAVKVTTEIAAIRGVPAGQDCVSPPAHSAFSDVDGLIEFVELIAQATGPSGGHQVRRRRERLLGEARRAHGGDRRRPGLHHGRRRRGRHRRRAAVVRRPRGAALQARLRARLRAPSRAPGWPRTSCSSASGRLGFPDSALFAFALGCDLISVGREAMLAIGCIQAQRCHTGRCPTGWPPSRAG